MPDELQYYNWRHKSSLVSVARKTTQKVWCIKMKKTKGIFECVPSKPTKEALHKAIIFGVLCIILWETDVKSSLKTYTLTLGKKYTSYRYNSCCSFMLLAPFSLSQLISTILASIWYILLSFPINILNVVFILNFCGYMLWFFWLC